MIIARTQLMILFVLALFAIALAGQQVSARQPEAVEIDQEQVAAHGIRRFQGKHIDLYTDLPEAADIVEMTEIFDQAVPQWCEYFGVDQSQVADWKLSGFLMADREKFVAAGLWLDDLPQFLNGYQLGPQFWLDEQPSLYYRRHLMLHEGTHAFMNLQLGGLGPPWYSEGMAELLGCHQWSDGVLKLGHRIASREESPYWGRVKVIQDSAEKGILPDLQSVMAIEQNAFLRTEAYAWSWAATSFFDGHPELLKPFRELQSKVSDRSAKFSTEFLKRLQPEWESISEQWQVYLAEMDYGYDLERTAVVYRPVTPLTDEAVQLEIDADRGWQSTGFSVKAGQPFSVRASGRFQVAKTDRPWISEPQGITIEYWRGLPLGAVQMAVRSSRTEDSEVTALLNPTLVGSGLHKNAETEGTIFVRINDSPAALDDNAGKVGIQLRLTKHDELQN